MAHWAKVVAILEMPNPTDVHTLRSFIGLSNYYRIYVQDFSTIAHPLYALLKKIAHNSLQIDTNAVDSFWLCW
jgi:hypothetical protein